MRSGSVQHARHQRGRALIQQRRARERVVAARRRRGVAQHRSRLAPAARPLPAHRRGAHRRAATLPPPAPPDACAAPPPPRPAPRAGAPRWAAAARSPDVDAAATPRPRAAARAGRIIVQRRHLRGALAGERDRQHAAPARRPAAPRSRRRAARSRSPPDVDVDRRVRAPPRAQVRDQPPRQHADDGGVPLRGRRDRLPRPPAGAAMSLAAASSAATSAAPSGASSSVSLNGVRAAQRAPAATSSTRPDGGRARPEAHERRRRRGPRPARRTAGVRGRALPAPRPSPPRAPPRRGGDRRDGRRRRALRREALQRLDVAAPDLDRGHRAGGARDGDVARHDVEQRPAARSRRAHQQQRRRARRALRQPVERRAQRGALHAAADDDPGQRIALRVRDAEIDLGRRVGARAQAHDLAQQLARAARPAAGSADSRRANSAVPAFAQPGPDRRQHRRRLAQHALHRRQTTAERRRAAPRLVQRRAQREQIDRAACDRRSAPRAPRSPACRARRRAPRHGGPARPKSIRMARPSPARRTLAGQTSPCTMPRRARAPARRRDRAPRAAGRARRSASSAMLAMLSTPAPETRSVAMNIRPSPSAPDVADAHDARVRERAQPAPARRAPRRAPRRPRRTASRRTRRRRTRRPPQTSRRSLPRPTARPDA